MRTSHRWGNRAVSSGAVRRAYGLGAFLATTLGYLAGGGAGFGVPSAWGGEASSDPSLRTQADAPTNRLGQADAPLEQKWNWHIENTDVVQYHPHFSAAYSGPNSLAHVNEVRETVALELYGGVRLWRGAEAHVDGLMWQGFGLSDTRGVEGFPNGEAFKLGTEVPNVTFARVFVRQTIGLGGDEEAVEDGDMQLSGRRDVSRLTFTVGKLNAKDIFDNNLYANDPATQFLNWSLMANPSWDYPADALGYITGLTAELNQPSWTLRYGFFQMPRYANGIALDPAYLRAWGMVTELERRYTIATRPGTVRLLAYLNRADMGSYQLALDDPVRPANIQTTRNYRYKFGFGLNMEQEVAANVGVFMRLGWSDGRTEAWVFDDVDRSASVGVSVKGAWWQRPADTFGLAGVLNGASSVHEHFLAAGGTGILAGDGALSYGLEKIVETYYDCQIWRTVHAALDYQFIVDPAFNRDRGPVSVFSARLHWSY